MKQNLIRFIFRCLEGFTFFDVAVQCPATLGAGSGSLKSIWHLSAHVRLFDFLSDGTVSKVDIYEKNPFPSTLRGRRVKIWTATAQQQVDIKCCLTEEKRTPSYMILPRGHCAHVESVITQLCERKLLLCIKRWIKLFWSEPFKRDSRKWQLFY